MSDETRRQAREIVIGCNVRHRGFSREQVERAYAEWSMDACAECIAAALEAPSESAPLERSDEPEYAGTCPFAIYGPPAVCTCRSCDLVEYWRSRADDAETRVAGLCAQLNHETCGESPTSRSLGMKPDRLRGCGGPVSGRSVYRCADCAVPFHQACIKRHFGQHHGAAPLPSDHPEPSRSDEGEQ